MAERLQHGIAAW
jgi:hypothetical protein